jgi:hypothetical protein
MSKFTLNTQEKELKFKSGLEIKTKGLLSVKEKQDLTDVLLKGKDISEGKMGDFLSSTMNIFSRIIVDWNAYNEKDEKLEIIEDTIVNVLSLEDILETIADLVGLDMEEAKKKLPQKK